MAILSSRIRDSHEQKDGRSSVIEEHTDHRGETYLFAYIADIGFDTGAALTSRAVGLDAHLSAKEREKNLTNIIRGKPIASITFHYTTVPAWHTFIREEYLRHDGLECCYISRYLDTLVTPVLMDMFGYTNLEVGNMRLNRFDPHKALISALRSAVGE